MMIEYPDFLPPVPVHLIESLDVIETRINDNPFQRPDLYASRRSSEELTVWCQQFFDYPIVVKWQVQKVELGRHVDTGITGWKYVYYVNLGGENVKTCFYESLDDDSKILHEEIAVLGRWYCYKIDEPHGTEGLSVPPRISITIRKIK